MSNTHTKGDSVPMSSRSIRPTTEATILFIVLTACALVGSIVTSLVAERILVDEIRGDAADLARVAALVIDPADQAKLLAEGRMWSDAHKAALAPLVDLHRKFPSITRIRSVVQRGGGLVVILDTETVTEDVGITRPVDPVELGEPLPQAESSEREILSRAIRDDTTAVEPHSEPTQFYGTLLSGAAPLRDGRSAVEVELDVERKESALAEVQIWARAGGGIAIFAAAVVSVIFFNLRSAHLAAETTGREAAKGHAWLQRRNETLVRAFGQIVLHRNFGDGFLLWDGDTEGLLGKPHDRMPTTLGSWLCEIHPDDQKRVRELVAQVGNGQQIYEIEYRVCHSNGQWRWFLERGAVAEASRSDPAAVDSVLLDITDQKRDHDERAALALIASRTDNGVCLMDSEGTIEWTNTAFSKISGFPGNEVKGQKFVDLLSSAETGDQLNKLMKAAMGGEGGTADVQLKRKDETTYWAEMEIQALANEVGRPSKLVAIQTDVTGSKRFQKELVEARDAAQAADRAKSEFLAVMSHEIRTPLNSVIGFTNLLRETPLNDQQRDYIETIRTSGDNLLILINDILDFSKVEANSVRLETAPFDLREFVEEVFGVVKQAAAAKGLELVCDIDFQVPHGIVADRARLRQVLLNLVSNSVKFTTEGEVVVRVRLAAERPRGEVALRFEVNDTGPGIDPKQQDLLFKPFSQADSSATRKFGGTGLGLAISKSLVNLMKGEIGVSSRLGQGSCFWFQVTVPSAPTDSSLLPDVLALDGARVLLVESNKALRNVLSAQLIRWGMTVESCQRGRDAIYAADIRRFDVALVATNLPDMDGVGLIDRIRRTPRGGASAVILLAPTANPPDPRRLVSAVNVQILTKPVRLAAVAEALLRATRRLPDVEEKADPPARPVPVENAAVAEVGTNGSTGIRVLIADDNAINRKLIDKILVKMGHLPHVVANGLECLNAVRDDDYDIILMDIQMPEMDGLTATRKIRDLGKTLPIIALTANAMPQDRAMCMDAGMTDYLSKPIRAEALAEAIDRFVSQV